jgi:hypothetical protein
MMLVEGRGEVSPPGYVVRFSEYELDQLIDEAKDRRAHRSEYGRTNQWKKGSTGFRIVQGKSLDSSTSAILAGIAGEYATCRFLNERAGYRVANFDLSKNNGDDGTDIWTTAPGVSLQVKSRVSRGRAATLVRRLKRRGNTMEIIPYKFSVLVCCEYAFGNSCRVIGWLEKKKLREKTLHRPPRGGDWRNIVVFDRELETMKLLSERIVFQTKDSLA